MKTRPHIVDGKFQSDKYPTCPPDKVPLSVNDSSAQDLLWEYAHRRKPVDAEFSQDLEQRLLEVGFEPSETILSSFNGKGCRAVFETAQDIINLLYKTGVPIGLDSEFRTKLENIIIERVDTFLQSK